MPKRKADSLRGSIRVRSPSEFLAKQREPHFISHLLAPERIHDCYFVLGEKSTSRVGAVKQMLLAHSSYFRACLHENKNSEPEIILACDLTPPTVENLLRYIYGYDNIKTLTFNEANRLLYAAYTFVLESLKDNLAVHLSSLLTYENICILLDNPACYQQLFLRSSINKILQYETEKILANPSFLNVNVNAFVEILKQDSLTVPEIELWRAALKWATKRVGSNDGQALRTELTQPLKHIRLCSLSPMDLCKEVIPTGVLTDAEVRLVTTSVGLGEKQNDLKLICNETRCRSNPEQPDLSDPHVVIFPNHEQQDLSDTHVALIANPDQPDLSDPHVVIFPNHEQPDLSDIHVVTFPGFTPQSRTKVMSFGVITKDCGLELLPFEFTAKQCPNPYVQNKSETYECSCTIQVINELTDSITFVGYSQRIKYGESFSVPIQSKGENVRLLPNSEYTIKINFTQPIWYYSSSQSATFSNEHFEARFDSFAAHKNGWYLSPVKKLSYRCVKS